MQVIGDHIVVLQNLISHRSTAREPHRIQVLVLTPALTSGLGRVSPSTAREEGNSTQDDATDEIMDRLVQSVTQNPSDRQSSPKNRKRSRVNRKSREYGGWFPGLPRWAVRRVTF